MDIRLTNAEALIRQMCLHPNVLQDFAEGVINYSEEPHGILYWATEEQKKIIERIEGRVFCKVWHIIKGIYRFGDGEYENIETYLLANQKTETLEEWNDGYLSRSYSRFISAGTTDYGDVVIKPHNGGLKRIM
jgi:hypothetical protein